MRFKKDIGREATRDEVVLNLKNYMTDWIGERMYIVVEFQHATTEELMREFRNFLRERKKNPEVKKTSQMIKGKKNIPTICTPYQCMELQRYLNVYDLHKKGVSIPEISKMLWIAPNKEELRRLNITGDHYDEKDIQRSFRRDLQKAKKIINNVEWGFFPGELSIGTGKKQVTSIED